jgi:hypothetical protein
MYHSNADNIGVARLAASDLPKMILAGYVGRVKMQESSPPLGTEDRGKKVRKTKLRTDIDLCNIYIGFIIII